MKTKNSTSLKYSFYNSLQTYTPFHASHCQHKSALLILNATFSSFFYLFFYFHVVVFFFLNIVLLFVLLFPGQISHCQCACFVSNVRTSPASHCQHNSTLLMSDAECNCFFFFFLSFFFFPPSFFIPPPQKNQSLSVCMCQCKRKKPLLQVTVGMTAVY